MRRRIVFLVLLGTFIGLAIWITGIGKLGIYSTFTGQDLLRETGVHLKYVGLGELIAIVVGVSLGVVVSRPWAQRTRLSTVVVGAAGMGQCIPSMALIALMAPILGFGLWAVVVALFVYGLLPILRNTYAGFRSIDPAIIEAAQGMGMSRGQIVRRIELPLARPVIMAGIRTSTVVNVGTAALAVLVGGAGLGRIILTGVLSRQPLITLQGAAPTAALAIVLDFLLDALEDRLTPKGLKVKKSQA
ncbi:MAG: hypothetical protein XD60_0139 [Acetothermia bacterium 64_32]|nr:MAG: hypothetical protein XD60_0139 [Acetothermia bacterium 64_32]HAF70803.1 glycine/betaine ABC transporter [Candidatus Acetothermia bacterium]